MFRIRHISYLSSNFRKIGDDSVKSSVGKLLCNGNANLTLSPILSKRYFYKWMSSWLGSGWLNVMFNKPDEARIKQVGPDKACAEWFLRNGAEFRAANKSKTFFDYNQLNAVSSIKVVEIKAQTCEISDVGFAHLAGTNIETICLIDCDRIGDDALRHLLKIKHSLKYLLIDYSPNISDKGLEHLHGLHNLEDLILSRLMNVSDPQKADLLLKEALPKCNVQFHQSV